MLRRRERLCVNMSGVEVTGTEAPLKKESTGLGDRLTKAEGGPAMCLAGLEGLATQGTWRRLLASGAAGLLECLLFSVGRIAYISSRKGSSGVRRRLLENGSWATTSASQDL